MKQIKILALLVIVSISMSSCGIFSNSFLKNRDMMAIEKGMTKNEILRLVGDPDFRNFDNELEEWIYVKSNKELIIGFYNNLVETMNTYPIGTYQNKSAYPQGYSGYSTYPTQNQPIYRQNGQVMRENDFQQFYRNINSESNKDTKFSMLRSGVYNRSFTCAQCARLMSTFNFDDEKLEVLNIMAHSIVDFENQNLLFKELRFISSTDKAKQIIDNVISR